MKLVLVGVRRFEKDVDDYEQTMASKTKKEGHENALSILPKRKKASPHTQQIEVTKEGQGQEPPTNTQNETDGDVEEVQRPAREIIEALSNLDNELVSRVSPRSKTLKTFIKMPMMLLTVTAALLSGLTIVFRKLLTELMQSGSLTNRLGLVAFIVIFMSLIGVGQLHILNLAMKFYDQNEAIPVYQTSVMISWLITGMIVFNEI